MLPALLVAHVVGTRIAWWRLRHGRLLLAHRASGYGCWRRRIGARQVLVLVLAWTARVHRRALLAALSALVPAGAALALRRRPAAPDAGAAGIRRRRPRGGRAGADPRLDPSDAERRPRANGARGRTAAGDPRGIPDRVSAGAAGRAAGARRPPIAGVASRRADHVPLRPCGGRRPWASPILDASRTAGIPHASVCGGRGRCSTCRVRISRGLAQLPPASDAERRVLARVGAPPDVRLACQARPMRDVTVEPLLAPSVAPADAFGTDVRQGHEQELAVLFADLRGFTRMAEHKLPYDVVFFLNRYFEAVGRAITQRGRRDEPVHRRRRDGAVRRRTGAPRRAAARRWRRRAPWWRAWPR